MAWPSESFWAKCNDNAANTVVTDSSSNANNGVMTGGNTSALSTTGKINQAFNFNGSSQYYTVSDTPPLSPTGNVSISIWVNPTTIADNKFFLHKVNSYSFGRGLTVLGNTSGKISFSIANSGVWSKLNFSVDVSTSTWTHLVATYDGTIMRGYVNSVADPNTTSPSISISDTTNNLEVGGVVSTYFYNGLQDDLRIFSGVALTQAQINAIYNSGNGTESSLASLEPSATTGPRKMTLLGCG